MNEMRKLLPGAMVLILSLVCGCDFGRMYDQDVIKTYGKKMPEMDTRTVPVGDGLQNLVSADPRSLKNPLPYSKASFERGYGAYGYYCIQCHGVRLDGNGTVGQSFAPLPADLTAPVTLSQQDGQLYAKIRLGFKRHPRLFSTISADDVWAVIVYMRSSER
jgi:mono/diheme cytochrome c family protein